MADMTLVSSPKTKMRNATPMLLSVMPMNIELSEPPSYTAIGVPLLMLSSVRSTYQSPRIMRQKSGSAACDAMPTSTLTMKIMNDASNRRRSSYIVFGTSRVQNVSMRDRFSRLFL